MPNVRPAEAADDPALAAMDRAVWSPIHSPGPMTPHGETAFHPPRVTIEGTLVAIGDDGEPAGWISQFQPVPRPSNSHVRMITGLVVDPGHQRQGIAQLLLAAAAERARSEGATRLTLHCLSTNAPGLALYLRFGFVEEGRLHGEFVIGGEPVDDVLFALDLRIS